MNSGSENRLSPERLKQLAKTNAARAREATSTVTLTDGNWGALIGSVQLLTDATAQNMARLQELMTEERMAELMSEQVQLLEEDLTETQEKIDDMLFQMRQTLDSSSAAIREQTERSISEISEQAGRANERFSSECSEAETRLKRWVRKIVWISLIPSAAVLLSELLRLVL